MKSYWWPLTTSRLLDPRYQLLTPRERLYVEYIASKYSRRGPFYESDLEVAITLGVSEVEVRHTRRKVGLAAERGHEKWVLSDAAQSGWRQAWIAYTAGWKQGAKVMATQYLDVPISTPVKHEFYAPVDTFTFEQLLALVRHKLLTHADVAVWLALSYHYRHSRGDKQNHQFYITKKRLRELSGVSNVVRSAEHLYESVSCLDGSHLFEWTDNCYRLVFSKWNSRINASSEKDHASIQMSTYRELDALVAEKKAAQTSAAETKAAQKNPVLREEVPSDDEMRAGSMTAHATDTDVNPDRTSTDDGGSEGRIDFRKRHSHGSIFHMEDEERKWEEMKKTLEKWKSWETAAAARRERRTSDAGAR